jgi:hypothetical protein
LHLVSHGSFCRLGMLAALSRISLIGLFSTSPLSRIICWRLAMFKLITATLVPDLERQNFLDLMFTQDRAQEGAEQVRTIMGMLSKQYSSAPWRYYYVSNGGYFMCPDMLGRMIVTIAEKGLIVSLTPQGAGIVSSLITYRAFAATSSSPYFIDQWHLLKDFALDHPECPFLLRASE